MSGLRCFAFGLALSVVLTVGFCRFTAEVQAKALLILAACVICLALDKGRSR